MALIQGKAIYAITEVALTPLSSRQEADAAIIHTSKQLEKKVVDNHGLDSDTEGDEAEVSAVSDDVDDEVPPTAAAATTPGEHKRTSSVAEDVITRKGGYGRFAKKWFSKKGWTADQRRNLGMTTTDTDVDNTATSTDPKVTNANHVSRPSETVLSTSKNEQAKDSAANLLPKLLRTTQFFFGSSRSFYFSYDYDITRSFRNRQPIKLEVPLHTQVDPLYFWNRHIVQPFINAGQS